MDKNEILLTGYAKLPDGITAKKLYEIVAVAILVDKETGLIVDVDTTLVTDLAKRVVRELICGKSIREFEIIEEKFCKQYYGSAKKAIITAVRSCSNQYKQIF